MLRLVKKIYNSIMYSSFFLAIMGIYCKVTIEHISDAHVVPAFVIGAIVDFLIILFLRHQLQHFYESHLK